MQQNELSHYGVLGMKWGKHKAKGYVTVRQASKNAKAAMDKARKDSIAADKAKSKSGERVTYRQASKNASEAMKTARKESIAKDKAHNQQRRSEKKQFKSDVKTLRKTWDQPLVNVYDSNGNHVALVNRSIQFTNELARTKGKDYADRVYKSARNKTYAEYITATAVASAIVIGSAYVNG